jgi:hypothetical protein
VTVLLDDHLLRDWMAQRDRALRAAVGGDDVATTNLWFARICRTGARAAGKGALIGALEPHEQRALVAALVRLPDDLSIVPMRELGWRMGELSAEMNGLSTLGSEVVAAAEFLKARVLVSSIDDGPAIRRCCQSMRIRYNTVRR